MQGGYNDLTRKVLAMRALQGKPLNPKDLGQPSPYKTRGVLPSKGNKKEVSNKSPTGPSYSNLRREKRREEMREGRSFARCCPSFQLQTSSSSSNSQNLASRLRLAAIRSPQHLLLVIETSGRGSNSKRGDRNWQRFAKC